MRSALTGFTRFYWSGPAETIQQSAPSIAAFIAAMGGSARCKFFWPDQRATRAGSGIEQRLADSRAAFAKALICKGPDSQRNAFSGQDCRAGEMPHCLFPQKPVTKVAAFFHGAATLDRAG
jgi:hypothetical protein